MKAITFSLIALFLAINIFLSAQETEKKEVFNYSVITEAGIVATSTRGFSMDVTVVNGFSMNKQHVFGLGIGLGWNFYSWSYSYPAPMYSYNHSTNIWDTSIFNSSTTTSSSLVYTPIFLNYRCYFKPNSKFSPHINISAGGIWIEDGGGIYSAIAAGFRAGKFSFSSGLSLMAIHQEEGVHYYDFLTDNYISESKWIWRYPFGITIKVGFTF